MLEVRDSSNHHLVLGWFNLNPITVKPNQILNFPFRDKRSGSYIVLRVGTYHDAEEEYNVIYFSSISILRMVLGFKENKGVQNERPSNT